MHEITLVCSAHRENGLCNAEALLKILRSIEPEVIFLEMRPSEFDYYYQCGAVEAHAITMYREFKLFQPVLVDRYDIPGNLITETKRHFDRVFDFVEETSPEYRRLDEENDYSVRRCGFKYLNGVLCATRMARRSEIEDAIISRRNDQDLIRALEMWHHFIESRELEMVGNIYEYCRKNVFDTGVFLVGAAHKTGILKEIEKYASKEADLINWNLAYDGQIP